MIRATVLFVTLLLTLASACHSQVDVADKGETGFGFGGAGAFASGTSAWGGNVSATIKGFVDFGFLLSRVSSGRNASWVKGMQMTLLPLRTNQDPVRWSLGGFVSYETGQQYSSPDYSFNIYEGLSTANKSASLTTIGALMTIDIALSRKADFQLLGSFAGADRSNSTKVLNIVTIGAAIVAKNPARDFYIGSSVSIPSDESYTTFGIQTGFFFKTIKNRGRI